MGSSSSKRKNEEIEELNNNKNKDLGQENIKKAETFEYKYEPEKEINGNNKSTQIQSKISEPISEIKYITRKMVEKDYNLEIKNYFQQNNNCNCEDRNTFENIKRRIEQIIKTIKIKKIKNYINDQADINQKINMNFYFSQYIKDDFEKTKTHILCCSGLNDNDAKLINKLEYNDFLKDEENNKKKILQIINKNTKEIISLSSKL